MITQSNMDLTTYNSYRLPSIAKHAFFPKSKQDIEQYFQYKNHDPYTIIGGGANIILAASHYPQDFVIIRENLSHIEVHKSKIYAEAGIKLQTLAMKAASHHLSGLEVFYDIPGTLGGAIRMNAGAYGTEISQFVESVILYLPQTKEWIEVPSSEIQWQYRTSSLNQFNGIIFAVNLTLSFDQKEHIIKKMQAIKQRRRAAFPYEYPNAGSVFKRPSHGMKVGEMVEALNLKGHRIGGAKISEKHGGFIINDADASSEDIIALAHLVQERILKVYGVKLDMEQVII